MKLVIITELKARLRAHIQLVKDGEEVLAFDFRIAGEDYFATLA